MKSNYERIVKHHQQAQPGQNCNQISEEVKFQVFQAICECLFQSFSSTVAVKNFEELSGGIFAWLEEHCKPRTLREVALSIMNQLKSQLSSRR